MKGYSLWSYAPYKPLFWNVGDIYICRIAPNIDSIHFEWLGRDEEYHIFYRKKGTCGFTCLGGDYLCNNARTSKENAIFQHKELVDIISKYGQNPLAVVAVGNHDYNVFGSDENAVMPDELFDILMTHHSDVMYDKENPKGLYGYYDDKKAKLRMIFLNLMDMPDENKAVNHSAAAIGTAQLKWLVNCGLNLPDSEWGVVFFSHYEPIPHPFTGATRVFGGEALWGVICAFKNGTAFSASAKRGEMQYYVDCDFTKQGKRDVIGYFYGHHHCDLQWSEAGIPLISCLAAASDNFRIMSGNPRLFNCRDESDEKTWRDE